VVALKLIHPRSLGDRAASKRFLREMRLVSRLDHPNIAHALDAGEHNGQFYLAVEFVEGTDLGGLVKEKGPLPIGQACDVVRQAALALGHAHDRGLVHRDVKPSNLLLGPTGLLKLLDLGLARLGEADSDSATSLTGSGMVMGTPDYMAPEQALDAHQVDIRADLYSLGCTLYFLLTGQPPFPGGTLGHKFHCHQHEEPAPLESLRRDVPVALVGVVRKLMAKKPEERFQTPAELVAELERLMVRGRWRPATPFTSLSEDELAVIDSSWRLWGKRVRSRWLLACFLGVLLCVAGAAAVFVAASRRPADAVVERPDQGAGPLDRLRAEDIPAGERFGWQPRGLVRVLGSHRGRQWSSPSSYYYHSLAVSPDGKRVATANHWSWLVQVWDTTTLEPGLLCRAPGPVYGLDFLQDNRTLLFCTYDPHQGYVVMRWEVGKGAPRTETRGVQADHFSHDGRRALWARGAGLGGALLFDVQTGNKLLQEKTLPGAGVRLGAAFSRDGKQALLAWPPTGDVVRVDAATGKVLHKYSSAHKTPVISLAFLPDGKGFLSGGTDDGVRLFRPGRQPLVLQAGGGIPALAVSRDGKRAAWAPWGHGKITCWDLEKHRALSQFGQPDGPRHVRLAFLDDGRLLSVDNAGRLFLWDVDKGKEAVPLDRHPLMHGLAFAPQGDRIVACGERGWLRVWDVLSGKPRTFQVDPTQVRCVCFCDDSVLCGDQQGRLVLLDADTGKPSQVFSRSGKPVQAVLRGADGLVFAGGGYFSVNPQQRLEECAVRVFDSDGKERFRCVGHTSPVSALALSGDGRFLLSGSEQSAVADEHPVRLWDAHTGKQMRGFQGTAVTAVALAPDGCWAVSASSAGALCVYDLESSSPRVAWTGHHRSGLVGAAVSADGKIVSADSEGLVRVWMRKGKKLDNWEVSSEWELPGPVQALALARDGKHVATANSNGTVYVLRLPAPPPRKKP
jgi:WD40 repeat protein